MNKKALDECLKIGGISKQSFVKPTAKDGSRVSDSSLDEPPQQQEEELTAPAIPAAAAVPEEQANNKAEIKVLVLLRRLSDTLPSWKTPS